MIKYNTIFFDLDDTLIDTKKNSYQTLFEIYEDYNLKNYYADFEFFAQKYQNINNDLWHLYELGQVDKQELQTQRVYLTLKDQNKTLTKNEAFEINRIFMNRVSEKVNLIEGAIEALDFLKHKKYKLNILSNGFKEIQGIKLRNAGIESYFENVILSDHIGKNKPHPDLFDYALTITGAKRENSIMIGDNISTDILGAKNSNIDQIWFNPQKVEKHLDLIPTFEIDKLTNLSEML